MSSKKTRNAGSIDVLVGAKVKVPRIANPRRCWWVTVLERRGAFIRVGGNKNAGAPWWMEAKDVQHVSRPNDKINRRGHRA